MRVVYVSPPRPPSPVPEESEEGSSPRASESSNGNSNTRELTDVRFGNTFSYSDIMFPF